MLNRALAVPYLMVLGLACVSPESVHKEHVQSIQMWKEQCGLLWIVDTDPMIRVNIQVTSKEGRLEDYGSGTILDGKHLISSFCRTQWTSTRRFTMVLASRDGIPISGKVEAWYNGKLLDTFTFDRTSTYQATVSIGKEKP